MRNYKRLAKIYLVFSTFCLALQLQAQDLESPKDALTDTKVTPDLNAPPDTKKKATEASKSVDNKPVDNKSVDNKSVDKMVQSATINLQTTVTGNQEQPRVLYILPWQSPAADDVDFESIDNEEKAVFSHVERDEFRRELESAGE
jgi:hypothetical protein